MFPSSHSRTAGAHRARNGAVPASGRRRGVALCTCLALLLATLPLLAVAPASAGPAAASSRLAPAAEPVHLAIPTLDIEAPVQPIALAPDLADLGLPSGTVVGWDVTSALPGASGNVVITGYLDHYMIGEAIFWDLETLQAGDEVTLETAGGERFTYAVRWRHTYPLASLTAADQAAILGATAAPSLTLITEAGHFDPAAAAYTARQVVRATLIDPAASTAAD